jgi:hypothetical protein
VEWAGCSCAPYPLECGVLVPAQIEELSEAAKAERAGAVNPKPSPAMVEAEAQLAALTAELAREADETQRLLRQARDLERIKAEQEQAQGAGERGRAAGGGG